MKRFKQRKPSRRSARIHRIQPLDGRDMFNADDVCFPEPTAEFSLELEPHGLVHFEESISELVDHLEDEPDAADLPLAPLDAFSAVRDANIPWNPSQLDFVSEPGEPPTFSWSIVPDGLPIQGRLREPDSPSDFVAYMDDHFGGGNGDLNQRPWFSIIEQAFAHWSDISGVSFVYKEDLGGPFLATPGSVGAGDIRIGGHPIDGYRGVVAYAHYPNVGELVMDTDEPLFAISGADQIELTLIHEIGHALGLRHVFPANRTKIMEPILVRTLDGPQFDDKLAIQQLYGDAFEPNDARAEASQLGLLSGSMVVQDVSIDASSDIDHYAFTIDSAQEILVQAVPLGTTYQLGRTPTSVRSFAAGERQDLALELVAASTGDVIAQSDSTGLGFAEVLSQSLAAGEYVMRVSGTGNTIQMYELLLTLDELPGPGNDSNRIEGTVWHDLNDDGVVDPDEPRIAGSRLVLDTNLNGVVDPGERSTLSDASGHYSFDQLDATREYAILQLPGTEWVQTSPIVETQAAVHQPVGDGTRGSVVLDRDNDGRPDLVVLNRNTHDVVTFSGGINGLEEVDRFDVGFIPVSLVTADFDNDHDADLAVANYGSDTVSIALNDGGRFNVTGDVATGDQPRSLTASDFNLDGNVDLAVLNHGSASLSVQIYHGNGDGTFDSATEIPTASRPWIVASGDMDLDGDHDLVVARGSVISIYTNDDGDFSSVTDIVGIQAGSFVELADLNADGYLDVIASNTPTVDLGIVLSDGAGGYAAPFTLAGAGWEHSAEVVDIDDDLDFDLVVTYSDPDVVRFFTNNGVGGFRESLTAFANADPSTSATADFNLDGRLDFVVGNYGSADVSFLANATSQHLVQFEQAELAPGIRFAPGTENVVSASPQAAASGDIDNDGDLDVVAVSVADNSLITQLNGGGNFETTQTLTVGDEPNDVVLVDLNSDGWLDAVTVDTASDQLSVAFNLQNGSFDAAIQLDVGDTPIDVAHADLDGDLHEDVVVVNQESDSISVFAGSASGDG